MLIRRKETPSGSSTKVDPQWSPAIADCAARIYGIYPLGARHWQAIGAAREEFLRSGATPNLTTLCSICGLPHTELAELFPDICNSLYALAGVPAPRATECIDPAKATTDAVNSTETVSPENEERRQ